MCHGIKQLLHTVSTKLCLKFGTFALQLNVTAEGLAIDLFEPRLP